MVNRCVLFGCSATADARSGVSIHTFPKNPVVRRQWVKFVQTTRANFADPKPTSTSAVVCSNHFTEECFEVAPSAARDESGLQKKCRRLKEDAVPTIHSKNLPMKRSSEMGDDEPGTPSTSNRRSAYGKRERKRLLLEVLDDSNRPVPANDEQQNGRVLESAKVASALSTPVPVLLQQPEAFTSTPVVPKSEPRSRGRPKKEKTFRSKRTQCNIGGLPPLTLLPPKVQVQEHGTDDQEQLPSPAKPDPPMDESDSEVESASASEDCDDPRDVDWKPEEEEKVSQDVTIEDDGSDECNQHESKAKFVVYQKQLLDLFSICRLCCVRGATAKISTRNGTAITIQQYCLSCDGTSSWTSQPKEGAMADGNISLSAAILFAGALPHKALRVLDFWGVQIYTKDTFFIHQKKYLHGAIRNVWDKQQEENLEALETDSSFAGDARNDSMGHCAKYGSYSLLDTKRNALICIELVQSTEVKSSYHMELEGLKRCLTTVEEAKPGMTPSLTTDGHQQIQKYLRETKPNVTHYLDVWHVAKNLQKKLIALADKKKFALVSKWIRSIVYHLYWCAATSDGNPDLLEAKWSSIANHLGNIHTHDNPLFPKCLHEPVAREWFDPASEVYVKLTDILLSHKLLKSVRKLSPAGQTSTLEGYHATVIHFAPKMFHFGYLAMKSRLQLAGLHFNENSGRDQAKLKHGGEQYNIAFPKYKKGGFSVKRVLTKCTFNYVTELQKEVRKIIQTGEVRQNEEQPPPLSSNFEHPDKLEAIKTYHSRYAKK